MGLKATPYTPRSVHVFPDPYIMAAFMVRRWRRLSAGAIAQRGRFAVALSGGKTPLVFYEMLSAAPGLPWGKTHIFPVDERFVPITHDQSNLGAISRILLQEIDLPMENVHAVNTDVKDAAVSARLYEQELILFFRLGVGEFPQFDLIMLGIGEDGHTASIFPGSPAIEEKERLSILSLSPKPPHERITLTLPVINRGLNVVFLAMGKEKASKMRIILEGTDKTLPAARVKPEQGKLLFLLDREALPSIWPRISVQ